MAYQATGLDTDRSASLPLHGRVEFSWQDVEDRLVEAMRHWWRSHDNEARFSIGGRISSVWRHYCPDRRDLILWDQLRDLEADEPAPLPLSRGDIARMTEASEWLRFVPERDRRLVIAALVKLAAGAKTVPWLATWKALGRGKPGPEGLRSRYSRGLTCIANALNNPRMAEKSDDCVSSGIVHRPANKGCTPSSV